VDPRPPAAPWRTRLPRLALAVVGATGLGLTHYRVLIMYALFVLAYLAIRGLGILFARRAPSVVGHAQLAMHNPTLGGIIRPLPSSIVRRPEPGRQLGALLGRALAVGVLGGLLFAPWFGNLLAEYLPGLFKRLGGVTTSYVNDYAPDVFLTQFIGLALPLLAVLGALFCLRSAQWGAPRMVLVLAAWIGLLALSARPDVVHLPGVGAMGTFTIGIMLYLPLATLAGPGVARLLVCLLLPIGTRVRRLWGRWRVPTAAVPTRPVVLARLTTLHTLLQGLLLLAALVLALGNPGALTTDPRFAYMTPDDLQVILWAGQHTPPASQFLISAQSNFAGRSVTATDAGMWLPVLAGGGRQTSVPPLSANAEGAQGADLARRVQALYTAGLTPTLASNVATLRSENISYVFVGEHTATISPTLLLRDGADYCLLRRQGASYLFGLRGGPAGACR
jgi:hypothetical protein